MINYLIGIIALGVLMVVHETGHYLAARAFNMRVVKFSIGMGPTLARFQPKGSPTLFQIGAIPFFAYVQIAGMNPLDESDAETEGSYAKASLFGRITTIFAGSLSNYLVASVFFFVALSIQGKPNDRLIVSPVPGQSAAEAGVLEGDRVLEIDGVKVDKWDQFRTLVMARADRAVPLVVDRGGERVMLSVKPRLNPESNVPQVGVRLTTLPVGTSEAIKSAIAYPPEVVVDVLRGIGGLLTGKPKGEIGGPVKIAKEAARAANAGVAELCGLLGMLSANLAAFNLLPIPALDGGRLLFLGYEAVSRRKPDAVVEAHVHLLGFVMLFTLMIVVTFNDIFGPRSGSEHGPAPAASVTAPAPSR